MKAHSSGYIENVELRDTPLVSARESNAADALPCVFHGNATNIDIDREF